MWNINTSGIGVVIGIVVVVVDVDFILNTIIITDMDPLLRYVTDLYL